MTATNMCKNFVVKWYSPQCRGRVSLRTVEIGFFKECRGRV